MEADELDDVELNYLRNKALLSRQQNSSSSAKSKADTDYDRVATSSSTANGKSHHKSTPDVSNSSFGTNTRSPIHSSSASSRSSTPSSSSYSSYSQQRSRSFSTHSSRSRSHSFSSKSSSSSYTSVSDSPRRHTHTQPPRSNMNRHHHLPDRGRDRGVRTSGRPISQPVRYDDRPRSSGRDGRSRLRPSSPYRSHRPTLQDRKDRPPPMSSLSSSARKRRNDIVDRRNHDSYQRPRQRSPRRKRAPSPPMRRRSPSPHRRHTPPLARRHSPPPRRPSPSLLRRHNPPMLRRRTPSPIRRRSLTPPRRRSPLPPRRRSPSPPRRMHRPVPPRVSPPRNRPERQIIVERKRPERRIISHSRDLKEERGYRKDPQTMSSQEDTRQRRKREERKRRHSDRDSDVPAKVPKSDDEETRRVTVTDSDVKEERPKSSTVTGGIDALDEELDYDESMDTLELYLREDESQPDVTVKSKVQRPSVAAEESPVTYPSQEDSPISADPCIDDDDDAIIDDNDDDDDEGIISDDHSSHGDDKEVEHKNDVNEEEEDSLEEGEDRTDDEDVTEDVKAKDKEASVSPPPLQHNDKAEADEKRDAAAVISSPIRLTPDRNDLRRGRQTRHKETKRGGGGTGRKLPVKERLYISKTDIAARETSLPPSPHEKPSVDGKSGRAAGSGRERVISYRKEHQLSSRLANRLGPAPRDRKGGGGIGSRGRDRKSSKRDALIIAEEFRRQKRKEELMYSKQEVLKGKRMAKYLNDHQSKASRSSHHLSGGKEEDLDKRINKIRNNNRRRLEREEEIRKDRQLYG